MRWAPVAAALAALAACVDFGLDQRRFRCDGDPRVCADGWSCSSEGYCVRTSGADASGEVCGNDVDDDGDDLVDCQDPDCGPESCDDRNPCTNDSCPSGGICTNEAKPVGPNCGNTGCMCESGGTPVEIICNDEMDNDGDELVDCDDPDCPGCAPELE
jgi:hypothetical protein